MLQIFPNAPADKAYVCRRNNIRSPFGRLGLFCFISSTGNVIRADFSDGTADMPRGVERAGDDVAIKIRRFVRVIYSTMKTMLIQ